MNKFKKHTINEESERKKKKSLTRRGDGNERSIVSCRYGIFSIPDRDDLILNAMRKYGEWAQQEINVLAKIIQSGDTVIDAGAFVGTHARAFSQIVGEEGKVIAFEPNPTSYGYLSENANLAQYANITTYQIALGDRLPYSGLSLIQPEWNLGGTKISEGGTDANGIVVRVQRLDDFDFDRIRFIKADLEGMEFPMLLGAEKTVSRDHPVIFLEVNNLQSSIPVIGWANARDYMIFGLISAAFNPDNFNGVDENTFGETVECGLLLIHRTELDAWESVLSDMNMPAVDSADSLALLLLHKPQYFHEAFEETLIAKSLGLDVPIPRVRELIAQLTERDGQINGLNQTVAERDSQIISLSQTVAERGAQIISLNEGIAERERRIAAIISSTSWRLTRPMRLISDQLKRMRRWFRFSLRTVLFAPKRFDAKWYLKQNPDVVKSGIDPYKHYILFGETEGRKPAPDVPMVRSNKSSVYHLLRIAPQIIAQKGGIRRACAVVLRIYRREGLVGIKNRIKQFRTGSRSNFINIETSLNPTASLHKNFEEKAFSIPEDATVSVIIPTLNASKYFPMLLPTLRNQKGFRQLEIVVVDSGSTDETLKLAKEYGAKIVEIPPEKFSHSYSRNLGAEKATGNYLFFTVQDAIPPSEVFLRECLDVFKTNDVVAVSCAEFPREDADLFYRVACWNHYEFLGVNNGDRILSKPAIENYITLRQNGQLSDIACFISRELFMKYTYRYDYAEDLDLGIRLIKDGCRIAFLSSLKIIHSHNRPPFYYLKRGYADQIFLTRIFPDYPKTSIKAEKIADEIVLAYGALNHLVADDLARITIPCRTKEFIIAVLDSFASMMKKSGTLNLPLVSPYIDEGFSTFLETLRARAHSLDKISNGHSLDLLQGVVNFVKESSFPYLTNSTEIIDEQMHEEFKAHLYKIFALLCGVNIANSFVESPDHVDDVLGEIRAELTKGV